MSDTLKNERNSNPVALRVRGVHAAKGWLLVGGLIAALAAGGCTTSNSALPALPGNGAGPSLGFAPGAPAAGALADAVVGNAYTAITISTTGASGASNITCSANIVLPDGFSVTANSANCVIGLSGATVTGSAQQISFSLHIHDSGNGADLFRNYSINVHSQLALAVNVDPGTAAGFAVAGRAYGTGAKTPVTFTASGGISPYIFTFLGTPPTGITCVTAAATVTCSGNSVTGVSGPYTVIVNDTGAPPTTPVSQKQIPTSFTVVPEIAIAVSPDPATNPAVAGRSYGQAPQAPPTFTATGGLTPLNNFIVTGTPPAPIACPGTTSVVCSGGAVTGATAAINASISDNGNTTTPANTKGLQKTITVNPILALTAPGVAPPTAVNSRAYGQGANCSPGPNCAPVAVGVAGGLGGYSAAINGTTGGGTAFACALSGANYNCSTGNVADVTASMTFALTTSDVANATTPAANSATTNVTIAVNAKLALTPPAAVPAAVSGRAFGQGAGCTGGACAPLQYTITGGLGNYAAGTLSDGTDAMACAVAAGTYSCSTAKINAAAGVATLVLTAPETGNASTPSANAVDNSKTLTIDAGLNVASNLGAAWPVAVQSSAYGTGNGCSPGPACTAAIYTASNGIAPYFFPVATPGSLPSGFNCATGAATYTCNSASVGANGNFSPSLTVVDTGDVSTPASTVATDPQSTITTSLTVATVLTLTAPGSAPPTAVTARRYGTGASCFPTSACATIPFTVTGGTGNYAASINDTTLGGTTFTCPLTGATYNCSTPNVADPAGILTLALTTSDTGNLTTPGVVASGQAKTNIAVAGVMLATPPGSVPAAVTGRAYGTGAGCTGGACVALQYTVSGGLGNYQAGTLGDGTDSMACSVAAGTYSCSIAAIAAGAGAPTLTLTATENGNTSAPGANAIDNSKTLTINSKLSLASSQGGTWANAVTARAYGTGNGCTPTSACSAEVFTASNGIGAYTFPGSTPVSFPAGFNCASGANTYTCSAANVSAAAAGFNPSVTVVDAGNASTPAATVATDPASQFTANLTVNGALTLTPPAGTPATAVFGRRYGTGVGCPSGATGCAPIPFTVSGGAGAYAASLSDTTVGNTVYTCPLAVTTYSCSAPNMADAATSTIALTAADAGNQSTPGGTGSVANKNVTVNAVMTVTPPASVPAAVTGRAFGTGNGCSPTSACAAIQYTIAGGLGNYQAGTLGDGTDSLVCGLAAGTYSCSSAAITGSVSGLTLTMSSSENGNASTPGANAADATKTLTIDAPLALSINLGNAWPGAVAGRTFGMNSTCAPGGTTACTAAIYAASNGVSPYVFPGSTPASFPGGLTCLAGASTYTCTSANVTATPGPFSPIVTITDTGNASTPAATVASDPASTKTSAITVKAEIVVGAPTPNPATNPAVDGLAYGETPQAPPDFATNTTGGLGGDTFSIKSGAPPTGIACFAGATSTCLGTKVTGSTSAFTVQATDTPNTSTPANTIAAGTATTITVNGTLTLTGATAPDTTPADAEQNAAYGNSGNALTYNITGGNTPYVNPTCNGVGGMAANLVAAQVLCSSTGISQTPGNALTLTVGILGTANQTTPAGQGSLPLTINVKPTVGFLNITGPTGNTDSTMPRLLKNFNYSGHTLQFNATGGVNPAASDTWALSNGPTGVTLSSAGVMGGTPSAVGTFATCSISVTDPGNTKVPPVPILVSAITSCPVRDTFAYIAAPDATNGDTIEVIRTANGVDAASGVASISLGSKTDNPTGVAVTPDGTRAYVTLQGADKFAVIDTALNAQITGSPFSLPAGCAPTGVAVTPNGQSAYFACTGTNQVIAISTADNTTQRSGSPISTGATTAPTGLAFSPDGTTLYVTLTTSATTGLGVITTSSNTISESALPAGCTGPNGIAVTPDDTRIYIACTTGNEVAVQKVSDLTNLVEISTGAGSAPAGVALDPTDSAGAQVFVTLSGSGGTPVIALAIIDNTLATPAQVTGSPFALPNPATPPGTDAPVAAAIPPHSSGGSVAATIYITQSTTAGKIDILDNKTPPTAPAEDGSSPLPLSTATAKGKGIAVIPLPK